MGTHRMRGFRAVATLIVAVVAFFLVGGGFAAAETVPPTSDSDVVIDLGGDGASDGGDAVIELAPATSKEIAPEEAAEAGQGETPEATAAAGVDGPAGVLWIAVGVAALLAGAFGLAQIGKRAEG